MTQTVEADVLRLFTSEAAFLAGSKRRQMGFDKATKRALLHNDVNDTLAMAWSDDSLQCLLAGPQTMTGEKTFNANVRIKQNILLRLGDGVTSWMKHDGTDTFITETLNNLVLAGYASIKLRALGLDILKVDSGGVRIESGFHLRLGNAWQSGAPAANGYVILKDVNGIEVQVPVYKP